jgi:ATP diphosphatase
LVWIEEKAIDIKQLLKIMSMLRDPQNGCPWDRKQSFQTIAPHTLEEVYEVVDTIERKDYAQLPNELGDMLFQIVFYAQLGKEQDLFDFDEVVSEIGNKLLQRHPHVFPAATIESFGDKKNITPDQVETNWEKIKQSERKQKGGQDTSILADIPAGFPALTRAAKIQKRASQVGFDWPDHEGAIEKIREETLELEQALAKQSPGIIEEELGDLFFSLVNLSRHLKIDAESCLRKATNKFEDRFRALESQVADDGVELQSLSIEAMEEYWQKVKKAKETN